MEHKVRGLPENIIGSDTPPEARGAKLLGAPIGHAAFAEALVLKRTKQIAENGDKLCGMGLSHPQEALQILTKSLSKRLDHAARTNDPSPEVLDALGTADKYMLAVLGKICGELPDVTADDDELLRIPAFARAVAAMAPSWGGLNIRPLRQLAELGVLHLASLNQSLPRLLERLEAPNAGRVAAAIAAEFRAVDTSTKPWAVSARAAYARLRAAVASPMSASDTAALKALLDGVSGIGEAVDIPPLLSLVTEVKKDLQKQASQAIWQRNFAELLGQVDTYKKFLLRSGCAPGASAFVEPINLNLFAPSHLAAADRMQADIFRMSLRYMLGLEPISGHAAAITAAGGDCPSCKSSLAGYDVDWITNHSISCAHGGWTQRIARSVTDAIRRNFADVGVASERETPGLSSTSAHKPGDLVTESMQVPASFDAGGEHRWVVDTTVAYLNATNVSRVTRADPSAVVRQAEAEKVSQIRKEVADGTRSALPAGYTFVPAAIDARGRNGPMMLKLHEWIAQYGARNGRDRGGEDGAEVERKLKARFRARVSAALHRTLMHAYRNRAQQVQKELESATGLSTVSALGLRFQGGGHH
jgi:hypothetical protein